MVSRSRHSRIAAASRTGSSAVASEEVAQQPVAAHRDEKRPVDPTLGALLDEGEQVDGHLAHPSYVVPLLVVERQRRHPHLSSVLSDFREVISV